MASSDRTKKAVEPAAEDAMPYEGSSVDMLAAIVCDSEERDRKMGKRGKERERWRLDSVPDDAFVSRTNECSSQPASKQASKYAAGSFGTKGRPLQCYLEHMVVLFPHFPLTLKVQSEPYPLPLATSAPLHVDFDILRQDLRTLSSSAPGYTVLALPLRLQSNL